MTTTTSLVPIGAGCTSVSFSSRENFLYTLETGYYFLAHGGEDYVGAGSVDLNGLCCACGGRREEVVDGFVVDFEVGTSEEIFASGCSANVGEYIFHSAWYDTWLFWITTLYSSWLAV